MKILLLGDYSGLHDTLGRALVARGHDVTIASDGCGFLRLRGTYSLRRILPGRAGGALLYARMRWSAPLRGYDVVQIISPVFARLRPHRLRVIFDCLMRDNGPVFLTAAGTDKAMMDYYLSPGCRLEYTEFTCPDGSPNHRTEDYLAENRLWQQGELGEYCEYVYDHIAGAATVLYEYHLGMSARLGGRRTVYTGLPVELPPVTDTGVHTGPLRIMLGRDRHRMAWKGTDRLEAAVTDAIRRAPGRATLDIVENLPYTDYLRRLDATDLLIDQLYSYTPALNALLAMARGKAVVSGGEDDFYRFIGEDTLRPIFNPVPDDTALGALFDDILAYPESVRAAAAQAREFVVRHNAADTVAQRYEQMWNALC